MRDTRGHVSQSLPSQKEMTSLIMAKPQKERQSMSFSSQPNSSCHNIFAVSVWPSQKNAELGSIQQADQTFSKKHCMSVCLDAWDSADGEVLLFKM